MYKKIFTFIFAILNALCALQMNADSKPTRTLMEILATPAYQDQEAQEDDETPFEPEQQKFSLSAGQALAAGAALGAAAAATVAYVHSEKSTSAQPSTQFTPQNLLTLEQERQQRDDEIRQKTLAAMLATLKQAEKQQTSQTIQQPFAGKQQQHPKQTTLINNQTNNPWRFVDADGNPDIDKMLDGLTFHETVRSLTETGYACINTLSKFTGKWIEKTGNAVINNLENSGAMAVNALASTVARTIGTDVVNIGINHLKRLLAQNQQPYHGTTQDSKQQDSLQARLINLRRELKNPNYHLTSQEKEEIRKNLLPIPKKPERNTYGTDIDAYNNDLATYNNVLDQNHKKLQQYHLEKEMLLLWLKNNTGTNNHDHDKKLEELIKQATHHESNINVALNDNIDNREANISALTLPTGLPPIPQQKTADAASISNANNNHNDDDDENHGSSQTRPSGDGYHAVHSGDRAERLIPVAGGAAKVAAN